MTAFSGRKGPVLIDIPKDIQINEFKTSSYQNIIPGRSDSDWDSINAAALAVNKSKRPIIIAGGGIISSDASDLLNRLSSSAKIPVSPTLMGLCSFDSDNEMHIGFSGMHGARYTNHIIRRSDLIIAIGTRFGDRSTGNTEDFAPEAQIIHVDIDSSENGKICGPEIFIKQDAAEFIKNIIPLIKNNPREEWLKEIGELKTKYPLNTYDDPGHSSKIIESISGFSPDDAVIVTDVGQHQMWTAQRFRFGRKNRFLTSGGLGTMGFGLPASIGAAIAAPDRKIILITGDGSIMMNIQEMALLNDLRPNLTIAVMNNSHLGLVRQQQELFYNSNFSACGFKNPLSFAVLGNAFGIESYECSGRDLNNYKRMFIENGTFLLDIKSQTDNVFPMVPPGKGNHIMIGEES